MINPFMALPISSTLVASFLLTLILFTDNKNYIFLNDVDCLHYEAESE
jgi:hypothetical protein